jgi:hypothetical protein
MPYRTCPKCKNGLSGIEGHRQIVLEPSSKASEPAGARFRCGLCGTYWRRSYVGDGLFLWQPDTDRPEPPLS